MSYSPATQNLFNRCVELWKPTEKLTVSEWADEFAYLSPESAHAPGKWTTLPYQRGIMDCFTDDSVELITVMKSARVGYTKILNQVIGYHTHHKKRSMLVVQPTVEDAQGYSKDELAPMLRDTPALANMVSEAKSRDTNSTILRKEFPGGFLLLIGANSPRGFRRISVPIVLFDEVDGYPPTAGQEGDQIKLGIKRTSWFWDKKICLGSTPTVKNLSKIESYFEKSDKRYYFVPCPFCGHYQIIKFKNIKWPKGDPDKAALKCVNCSELIPHSKKRAMIENGEWRATAPFNGHAGFFIWAGYSYAPNSKWSDIAKEFLDSKDDNEKLKTFVNTTLGQTWEEKGLVPQWQALKARVEPYEVLTVPSGGLLLFAGVDVQDNRLAVSVVAFGKGQESWLVYWAEIFGDPGQAHVWSELDAILTRQYPHASGIPMTIKGAAIDTGGHHTHDVYNYCRKRSAHVMAIKGANIHGKPIIGGSTPVDVNYKGAKIKKGVLLWHIGVDTAKDLLYQRLGLEKNEEGFPPGYCHFYAGLDEEYFLQLTAEKRVPRLVRGYLKSEWTKIRDRNEALDTFVYAIAAAVRWGINTCDFDAIAAGINGGLPATEQRRKRKPVVVKSKWMER